MIGLFRANIPGSSVAGVTSATTDHPRLIAIIVVAVGIALYFLWPRLKPRLAAQWRKAKQGGAIFSDWRRYAEAVALPSAASYCCRIGVNVVFMAAFGITITAFSEVKQMFSRDQKSACTG